MWLNGSKATRNLRVFYLIFVISGLNHATQAGLFDHCDHVYYINTSYSYVESPYYPYTYPPGTACRYTLIAPLDHVIQVNCTINLDKGAKICSTERFYLARDGDKYLRESEELCGSGTFIRKTLFNKLVLAYTSGGSRGSFRCQIRVSKQPCDCGWSIRTKIVNGQETSPHEFPSMVALRDRTINLRLYCSGAIISHRHILTAAHCGRLQSNPNYIEALVGRHNLETTVNSKYAAVYYISRIIEHPNYSGATVNNDIAILITTKDIEYSRAVGPICLPPYTNVNNDFAYNYVDVIGWGSTKFAGANSPTLQKVNLMVTSQQACVEAFQGQNKVYRNQVCTYDYTGTGKDSCQFDSGGPVIFSQNRQFIIGIISYGKACGIDKYSTGVNTRVTAYLEWIYQITGRSTCRVSM